MSWPWLCLLNGQFAIPILIHHHMANQSTKFEVSSFSHSRDILGDTENLNASRNHNHDSFRTVCRQCAETSYVGAVTVYQIWNLYVHPLQRTKNAEIGLFGGYGSFKVIGNIAIRYSTYDFLYDFTRNYMHLPCTVFELLSLISQHLKTSRDHDHAHSSNL